MTSQHRKAGKRKEETKGGQGESTPGMSEIYITTLFYLKSQAVVSLC